MLRAWQALPLVIFGCLPGIETTAPTVVCEQTVCGIRLDANPPSKFISSYPGEPGQIDCQFVANVERDLLAGAWKHWTGPAEVLLKRGSFCDGLKDFRIYVDETDGDVFKYTYNNEQSTASGLTVCLGGYMVVSNVPRRHNSMAHEMVHAISGCRPIKPCTNLPNDDCAHLGWEEMGVGASIKEAMGRD